jgi:hypothetical protein
MSALDTLAKKADEASKRFAGERVFLRKLEPSVIAKRATSGGSSPFLIVGAALVVGVALAKWIDWRGHAHPSR